MVGMTRSSRKPPLPVYRTDAHGPHRGDSCGWGWWHPFAGWSPRATLNPRAGTLRSAGAHIGGTARVTVPSPDNDAVTHTSAFTVVGTLPFPADFGTGGIDTRAALTARAYLGAECPPSLVPAALARHTRLNQDSASAPTVPTALVSFGESANFPLLVAIVVAACGLATLAHLLAVSVSRRRRENGLLKSLGLIRRQLAAIVCWQAIAALPAAAAAHTRTSQILRTE